MTFLALGGIGFLLTKVPIFMFLVPLLLAAVIIAGTAYLLGKRFVPVGMAMGSFFIWSGYANMVSEKWDRSREALSEMDMVFAQFDPVPFMADPWHIIPVSLALLGISFVLFYKATHH